jgi:hypothetical protein
MGSDTSAMGTAFATKLVAEQSRKVKFMYRESPSGPDDSGWHFFCGEEPQEYVDDPNNTGTAKNRKNMLTIPTTLAPIPLA